MELNQFAIQCAKIYVRGVFLTFICDAGIGAYMMYYFNKDETHKRNRITLEDYITSMVHTGGIISISWPVSIPLLASFSGRYELWAFYLMLFVLP